MNLNRLFNSVSERDDAYTAYLTVQIAVGKHYLDKLAQSTDITVSSPWKPLAIFQEITGVLPTIDEMEYSAAMGEEMMKVIRRWRAERQ